MLPRVERLGFRVAGPPSGSKYWDLVALRAWVKGLALKAPAYWCLRDSGECIPKNNWDMIAAIFTAP